MDGQASDRQLEEDGGSHSLDPADWQSLRVLGHTMLDDLFDDLEAVGDGRVWRPDNAGGIKVPDLAGRLATDRAAGMKPFLVVRTAGSVDIGAIDDLAALAELSPEAGLWFHIDTAFGAMATLSPQFPHLDLLCP